MKDDNYTVCPKCQKKLDDAGLSKDLTLNSTLREDYDVGVLFNGIFYVDYYCHCVKCGFEYGFHKDYDVEL